MFLSSVVVFEEEEERTDVEDESSDTWELSRLLALIFNHLHGVHETFVQL